MALTWAPTNLPHFDRKDWDVNSEMGGSLFVGEMGQMEVGVDKYCACAFPSSAESTFQRVNGEVAPGKQGQVWERCAGGRTLVWRCLDSALALLHNTPEGWRGVVVGAQGRLYGVGWGPYPPYNRRGLFLDPYKHKSHKFFFGRGPSISRPLKYKESGSDALDEIQEVAVYINDVL